MPVFIPGVLVLTAQKSRHQNLLLQKLKNVCQSCIILRIQRLGVNKVDPDETDHSEPPHLDLASFEI